MRTKLKIIDTHTQLHYKKYTEAIRQKKADQMYSYVSLYFIVKCGGATSYLFIYGFPNTLILSMMVLAENY